MIFISTLPKETICSICILYRQIKWGFWFNWEKREASCMWNINCVNHFFLWLHPNLLTIFCWLKRIIQQRRLCSSIFQIIIIQIIFINASEVCFNCEIADVIFMYSLKLAAINPVWKNMFGKILSGYLVMHTSIRIYKLKNSERIMN